MAAADTGRPVLLGCLACAAAMALFVGLSWTRLLEPVDNRVYDFLLGWRAPRQPAEATADILLVLIDEESMAVMNRRWPWPRSFYATMIDQFMAGGARAIGLDILFTEPSEQPAEDEALLAALHRTDQVVLAAKIEVLDRTMNTENVAVTGQRLVLPLPDFRHAAKVGVTTLELGSGSVVRDFKPGFMHQDREYPSFASELYQAATHRPAALEGRSRYLIDYAGPGGTFTAIPAYVVLGKTADPALFQGKTVLVGATFSDAHDLHATPLEHGEKLCPGVEVQANILATLARATPCLPMSRTAQVLLVVVMSLACGYLMLFRSAALLIAFMVCAAGATTGAAAWLLLHGVVLDITYPLLVMPVTALFASFAVRKPLVLETKVGPYRLLEEIGHGGMAVVYKARHPRTGEIVALKQILPQYAGDETMLDRFLSEIELIRSIGHPNIVRIVDAGEVNGQPYYAMEFVDGLTLETLLEKEHRLTPVDVRRICGGVARALARAHEVGVIHRDIKPANIMLTSGGSPKLMDFGIARRLDSPSLTQAGIIIGTPHYMAPEICRGLQPTPSSDIYSLGATMYHLLLGRPPLVCDDARALMGMILAQDPVDLRRYSTDMDEDLAALVMQCLQKEPGARPADMLEAARRLDPFFTDMAMHTRSLSPPDATHTMPHAQFSASTARVPLANETKAPATANRTVFLKSDD